MITDYNLGDWYYTKDSDGDVAGYLFVAIQGQFVIGTSEYAHLELKTGVQSPSSTK